MRLTTKLLDPARAAQLQVLPASLREHLPADYAAFIATYGPGTYAGEVVVAYPDATTIAATFGEHADLWELDERFTAADLQAATQLAWSHDGDIVRVVASRPSQVFVLPRHAEQVRQYASFWAAVASLTPPAAEPCFDPSFDAELTQLSLVRQNQLVPIEPIWQAFQRQFAIEAVLRAATQPVCLLPELGGWVSFDLIYKSSITVKFQRLRAAQAAPVLAFLAQCLNEGAGRGAGR